MSILSCIKCLIGKYDALSLINQNPTIAIHVPVLSWLWLLYYICSKQPKKESPQLSNTLFVGQFEYPGSINFGTVIEVCK